MRISNLPHWPRCRRMRSVMLAPIQECPELRSFSHIWAARRAVIGAALIALVAVSGLAGCGRKGGLDPPPVAAPVDDRGAAMQPVGAAPEHVSTGQALVPSSPRPQGTPQGLGWIG